MTTQSGCAVGLAAGHSPGQVGSVWKQKLSNLPKVTPRIPNILFQSPHSQLLFSSAVSLMICVIASEKGDLGSRLRRSEEQAEDGIRDVHL